MAQFYDANGNPVFTDVVQQAQVLGALNSTNSVQLRGQACATVQVTAIGTLTLTFEGSTDGSNFDPVLATPIAGGTAVSSTSANGHWVSINVAALSIFRVRVSAYTSGSAAVSVIASQGSPAPSFSATGSQKVDVASINGTALGTPTNFGTTPGGVVAASANASLFVGTTAVSSAIAGSPDVNAKGWGGTALGTPTNFGTTPGAVIAGSVNSSTFVGTTAAVAASAGVQKVGISGAAGTTLDGSTAGVLDANVTRVANTVLGVPTAFGTTPGAVVAQSVNSSAFIGTTAAVASSAGVQKVGIAGGVAGAAIDGAIAAVPPANALQIGIKAATANPANAAAGNAVAIMGDKAGRIVVTEGNVRELIGVQTTVITASTAETTIITAGAAGVFNDLSCLIITTTDAAAAVITIKDATSGTTRLTFNYPNAALAPTDALMISFPVPIPQAVAANNWTATVSVNAGSVSINCVYVKNN